MHLDTPRLTIRNFIPEDAADLQEILGDAQTMEYSEPPYDLEKTKQFLASFCIDRGGGVAAVHRETNKVIGYILFHQIQNRKICVYRHLMQIPALQLHFPAVE